MNIRIILLLLMCYSVSVSGQKSFTAKNGVTYKKGDTIIPTTPYDGMEYGSIFHMSGLSLKRFGNEINGVPLVVKRITLNRLYNSDGEFTYLKCDMPDGTNITVAIQSAIDLKEIEGADIPQLPREVPPDYKPFEFQGSHWGDNIAVVKERNGTPDHADDNTLTYATTVGRLEAFLIYYFNQGKLYQLGYSFKDKHSEDQLYIEDYNYINELLDEKYGAGETRRNWRNDLYKGNYNDTGRAISAGHLTIVTRRELPDANIHHGLNGDNFEISHVLVYSQYPKPEISDEKPLGKL